MADKLNSTDTRGGTSVGERALDLRGSGVFGRAVLRGLSKIQHGRLTVSLPNGTTHKFGNSDAGGPHGVVAIHRWRTLRRLATGGDLGMATAYTDGDWSSPDLTALFGLAIANEGNPMAWYAGNGLARTINRIRHLRRDNTKRGSRRNIAHHYDLGNAFYERWLDPTMTYSSARYTDADMSLEQAQIAKYDRILEFGEIEAGHQVLEIGSGWGGFAARAAARQVQVHGITVSREQLAYCEKHSETCDGDVKPAFSFTDYRDARGSYDRIVSIEMFEAVGEKHWPDYFTAVRDRMHAGGIAVLQVITIEDGRFEAYRNGADFIQRFIFPGGLLPSPAVLDQMIGAAGLILEQTEYFGQSYARTVAEWNLRFQKAWPELADLGFDKPFKRTWEYYLSYCEAGFTAGNINVGLFKIRKPV